MFGEFYFAEPMFGDAAIVVERMATVFVEANTLASQSPYRNYMFDPHIEPTSEHWILRIEVVPFRRSTASTKAS
jgi:hypothetical protein